MPKQKFKDRPAAWLTCEGSIAKPHTPLYFTSMEAKRGCPEGCLCLMVNKDHGPEAPVAA